MVDPDALNYYNPETGEWITNIVINPDTGEIRHVTPSEYKELGDEWKRTSPTFDELRAAGILGFGDTPQFVSRPTNPAFTPAHGDIRYDTAIQESIKALAPFRTPEGKIDILKTMTSLPEPEAKRHIVRLFGEDAWTALQTTPMPTPHPSKTDIALTSFKKAGAVSDDGKIDVMKAIEAGVESEHFVALGLSDEFRQGLKLHEAIQTLKNAHAIDSNGEVDIDRAIEAGIGAEHFVALGLFKEYQNGLKRHAAINELKQVGAIDSGGQIDVDRAIEAGISAELFHAIGLDNAYNAAKQRLVVTKRLRDIGVINPEGQIDIVAAVLKDVPLVDLATVSGVSPMYSDKRLRQELKIEQAEKIINDYARSLVDAGYVSSIDEGIDQMRKLGIDAVTEHVRAAQRARVEADFIPTPNISDVKSIAALNKPQLMRLFANEKRETQTELAISALLSGIVGQMHVSADEAKKWLIDHGLTDSEADAVIKARSVNVYQTDISSVPHSLVGHVLDNPETSDLLYATYQRHLYDERSQPLLRFIESMIPIWGTYLTAKERGWKSGWTWGAAIADWMIVSKIISVGGAAARTQTVASGRLSRVRRATTGIISSLDYTQVRANQFLKGVVTEPVRTLYQRVSPKYVPIAALEHSWRTARIPVSLVNGDARLALRLKHELMQKYLAGEDPIARIGSYEARLHTPFIRTVAHSTPEYQWIMRPDGVIVGKDLFFGAGAYSRFAQSSATGFKGTKGSVPGIVMVMPGTELTKIMSIPMNLYGKMAEIEAVIKAGIKINRLPKNTGWTIVGNKRADLILLEGNMSWVQRVAAKLGEEILELRSIVTPSIQIKNLGAAGKARDSVSYLRTGRAKAVLAEADEWEKAGLQAAAAGDEELASMCFAEAMAYRSYVMDIPIDGATAEALARRFAVSSMQLLSDSTSIRSPAERQAVLSMASVLDRYGRFYASLAQNRQALRQYNEAVMASRPSLRVIPIGGGNARLVAQYDLGKIRSTLGARLPIIGGARLISTARSPTEQDGIRTGHATRNISVRQAPRIVSIPRIEIPHMSVPFPKAPPRRPPETPPPMKGPPTGSVPPSSKRHPKRGSQAGERHGWVTWRQGIIWISIKPPYQRKSDIILTRTAPEGAKVVTGPESAYKTIQELGGKVRRDLLKIDIGAFDVIIKPAKRHLAYIRDTKRSKSPLTIKGVKAVG